MIDFNPYITFDGTCEEALRFYKSCFGGEILYLQYYRDAPGENATNQLGEKVMHSEFKSGPVHFMACDVSTGAADLQGNRISFYINFADPLQQKRTFQKLAEKGKIQVQLEQTLWQSLFGMVTDRYGVQWMLNCDINSGPNK